MLELEIGEPRPMPCIPRLDAGVDLPQGAASSRRPAGACASDPAWPHRGPGSARASPRGGRREPTRSSTRPPAAAWPAPRHRAGWSSHDHQPSSGSATVPRRGRCGPGSRSIAASRSRSARPRSRTSTCGTWRPPWRPASSSPPRWCRPRRDNGPRPCARPRRSPPRCATSLYRCR